MFLHLIPLCLPHSPILRNNNVLQGGWANRLILEECKGGGASVTPLASGEQWRAAGQERPQESKNIWEIGGMLDFG